MNNERLAGALKGIDIALEGLAMTIGKLAEPDETIDGAYISGIFGMAQAVPGLLALKEYYTAELNDQLIRDGLLKK